MHIWFCSLKCKSERGGTPSRVLTARNVDGQQSGETRLSPYARDVTSWQELGRSQGVSSIVAAYFPPTMQSWASYHAFKAMGSVLHLRCFDPPNKEPFHIFSAKDGVLLLGMGDNWHVWSLESAAISLDAN